MKNQKGNLLVVMLALALGIACMQSASAQASKKVNVAGNAPLAQVSAGGASVWAIASNGKPYILKGGSFALANAISQSQIAGGGGNPSSQVFEFRGNTQTFDQLPGSLTQIQAGGNGVWGLNSGQIFRLEPSTSAFVRIPGVLVSISVDSGGGVWGINSAKLVFAFTTP